jgi:hypothetical protein
MDMEIFLGGSFSLPPVTTQKKKMMILIILQLILVSTIPLLQRARYVSIIGIDFVFLSFDLIAHDLVVRTVRLAGTLS